MTTATQQFTFHCDPGHAWLEVTAEDIASLGLTPSSFSRYSFHNGTKLNAGQKLYLEEDSDATKFIEAFRKKHGQYPKMVDQHTNADSWVRELPHLTV
jgi:hypothetical protein